MAEEDFAHEMLGMPSPRRVGTLVPMNIFVPSTSIYTNYGSETNSNNSDSINSNFLNQFLNCSQEFLDDEYAGTTNETCSDSQRDVLEFSPNSPVDQNENWYSSTQAFFSDTLSRIYQNVNIRNNRNTISSDFLSGFGATSLRTSLFSQCERNISSRVFDDRNWYFHDPQLFNIGRQTTDISTSAIFQPPPYEEHVESVFSFESLNFNRQIGPPPTYMEDSVSSHSDPPPYDMLFGPGNTHMEGCVDLNQDMLNMFEYHTSISADICTNANDQDDIYVNGSEYSWDRDHDSESLEDTCLCNFDQFVLCRPGRDLNESLQSGNHLELDHSNETPITGSVSHEHNRDRNDDFQEEENPDTCTSPVSVGLSLPTDESALDESSTCENACLLNGEDLAHSALSATQDSRSSRNQVTESSLNTTIHSTHTIVDNFGFSLTACAADEEDCNKKSQNDEDVLPFLLSDEDDVLDNDSEDDTVHSDEGRIEDNEDENGTMGSVTSTAYCMAARPALRWSTNMTLNRWSTCNWH